MFATTAVRTARPRPRHRGVWETTKDARADRRMRALAIAEEYGPDAIDVIALEPDRPFPFVSAVSRVCGVSLLGLARMLHGTGRLHRVAEDRWVVYAN